MPALTSAAITDPDEFMRELDLVRDQGYAVDDEENQPDGRCVAVSIPRLPFPAGISVSGPASRFRAADVAPTAARLHRIAAALSRRMKE
jgi:IclR family acetate operon transcriptional repressor